MCSTQYHPPSYGGRKGLAPPNRPKPDADLTEQHAPHARTHARTHVGTWLWMHAGYIHAGTHTRNRT